jgi:hypothetical protein
MFIVLRGRFARSDPSAIACEETGRHVIVTVVPGSSDPVLLGSLRCRASAVSRLVSRMVSRLSPVAPPQGPAAEEHRMCDVTDDCGARVGADHSRRLTVYRITLAVSLLLQLYCAPVRAGSCPLYLRTRSLRPEDVARPGRSRGCRAATSTTNVSSRPSCKAQAILAEAIVQD